MMDSRAGARSRRTLLAAGGGGLPRCWLPAGRAARAPAPSGGAEQEPGAPRATVGPARLQMWFGLSGQQAEHHARVNERFTSEHPHLQVELLTVPESELTAKLATAIAGGRPPDLAGLGGSTRIAELIEHKRVVSLTRYRRDLARLDWYDALKRVVVRGEDIFALPTQAATLGLFYNADLYQRAGLDPNAPPATWASCWPTRRPSPGRSMQRWGHAIGTKPITWTAEQIWIAYLWQAGGEWLTPDGKQAAFNSAAGVEALEFWADLVQKHRVTPPKAVDNLVMGEDFEAGAVAHMTIYSIWVIRAEGMRFPVRTAPLPRHRQPASVAGMVTVPIFSESRQRDAAWAYLDWLSQPGPPDLLPERLRHHPAPEVGRRVGGLDGVRRPAPAAAAVRGQPAAGPPALLRHGRPGDRHPGRPGHRGRRLRPEVAPAGAGRRRPAGQRHPGAGLGPGRRRYPANAGPAAGAGESSAAGTAARASSPAAGSGRAAASTLRIQT